MIDNVLQINGQEIDWVSEVTIYRDVMFIHRLPPSEFALHIPDVVQIECPIYCGEAEFIKIRHTPLGKVLKIESSMFYLKETNL